MSLEVRSEAATPISIAMPWDPDRKQYVATRDLDSANSIGKVVQPHLGLGLGLALARWFDLTSVPWHQTIYLCSYN